MLHCGFSDDYNSERIFKIGQYLTKLCVEHFGFTFLAHPIYDVYFTPVYFAQILMTTSYIDRGLRQTGRRCMLSTRNLFSAPALRAAQRTLT